MYEVKWMNLFPKYQRINLDGRNLSNVCKNYISSPSLSGCKAPVRNALHVSNKSTYVNVSVPDRCLLLIFFQPWRWINFDLFLQYSVKILYWQCSVKVYNRYWHSWFFSNLENFCTWNDKCILYSSIDLLDTIWESLGKLNWKLPILFQIPMCDTWSISVLFLLLGAVKFSCS